VFHLALHAEAMVVLWVEYATAARAATPDVTAIEY